MNRTIGHLHQVKLLRPNRILRSRISNRPSSSHNDHRIVTTRAREVVVSSSSVGDPPLSKSTRNSNTIDYLRMVVTTNRDNNKNKNKSSNKSSNMSGFDDYNHPHNLTHRDRGEGEEGTNKDNNNTINNNIGSSLVSGEYGGLTNNNNNCCFFTRKHTFSMKNNPICGITFFKWYEIMKKYIYDVELRYLPRVLFITLLSIINTFLALIETILYGALINRVELPDDPVFIIGHTCH